MIDSRSKIQKIVPEWSYNKNTRENSVALQ